MLRGYTDGLSYSNNGMIRSDMSEVNFGAASSHFCRAGTVTLEPFCTQDHNPINRVIVRTYIVEGVLSPGSLGDIVPPTDGSSSREEISANESLCQAATCPRRQYYVHKDWMKN